MNKAFQALADPTRRTILKKLNKEFTLSKILVMLVSLLDITTISLRRERLKKIFRAMNN